VFYPKSPRYVEPDIAYELVQMLPTGVRGVGLFVNPSDAEVEAVCARVQLDMVQLHGDESVSRVSEIKALTGLEVMKALPIGAPEDATKIREYEAVSDWILCDTPSEGFGGSGQSFDWGILAGHEFTKPWMLAGGLTVGNVGRAIAALSPMAVDVSSGVEENRGVKSVEKIKAFLGAVKG
ncbi:MAG: phosphoribosylanthranilate isomerase, partial [Micavibrio sp.]|nr:phosphoribosylanthranilate isomerase [Micavibrio sp.]